MAEKDSRQNEDLNLGAGPTSAGPELDAAGRSLAGALRISFVALKIIMLVLIIAFLASGLKMVGPDERAIVLHFGKIRGVGEGRVLGPGPHWILPYPIQEMIKIPAEKLVTLPVNSFWYFQSQRELVSKTPRQVPIHEPLNPSRDGYCLTRGERTGRGLTGSDGSDYNIVHSKWQLTYKVDDIERFFRNVYVEEIMPGDVYFDSMTRSIEPLLKFLVEDAVVTAMVNYTIDEALESRDRIQRHVRTLLERKLRDIESGIEVISIYPLDITYPRQVNEAFAAAVSVSQESSSEITNARTAAQTILNETAGPLARILLDSLHDPNMTELEKERLWENVPGQAGKIIAEARAYRGEIVQIVKARAEYMKHLLPEYAKYPKLVIQRIYQDTMQEVFENAAEKLIAPPTEGGKGRQIRIQTNRSPLLKKEPEKQTDAEQKTGRQTD
ncbi:MAG: hypothetical protein JSU94_20860 [Phycisphaerales bacterium]|nr:MAG: hypothetical protein JSU94_20860 [Phycisphaerales bacterium]